jgi:SAM-dependent methyltransferase
VADFDENTYWEQRLGERYELESVGCTGLGGALNAWMYRVRRRVFLAELRRLGLAGRPELRALDIGSGTGFYVERWHELGVREVTGSDLTTVAIEQLRRRFPTDRFERFDVGGEELPFAAGNFDAISALDVLFHIVDDERFARAIRNLHTLLVPGGTFVFSDNFVHGDSVRVRHQASRPLETIEAIVRESGFEIVRRRPMFVLLNAPVDSGARALHAWWKALTIASSHSELVGRTAGALAYPIELALVERLREGPSTELMVCRRPTSAAVAV